MRNGGRSGDALKIHYFDQDAPDQDDLLLQQAIKEKRVPDTCLFGGAMVMEFAAKDRDPCGVCPCPVRDKCGGRPQIESLTLDDAQRDVKTVRNNEASATRLIRRSWIKDLIRAGTEAQKRKG